MDNCDHIRKVVTWGVDRAQNCKSVVLLYGCTKCKVTWDYLPTFEDTEAPHVHNEYVEGCFACKVKTLELGTGDAGRADSMPQKKWDKELSDFRDAHRQGVKPAGTSRKHIQAAMEASERTGMAFNSETMGNADTWTASKASDVKALDLL